MLCIETVPKGNYVYVKTLNNVSFNTGFTVQILLYCLNQTKYTAQTAQTARSLDNGIRIRTERERYRDTDGICAKVSELWLSTTIAEPTDIGGGGVGDVGAMLVGMLSARTRAWLSESFWKYSCYTIANIA